VQGIHARAKVNSPPARKYDGLMKGLKSVMDHWNECEAQVGERDWYVRFGYLYEQFTRDKYKRAF
jgi:hypothetical protein